MRPHTKNASVCDLCYKDKDIDKDIDIDIYNIYTHSQKFFIKTVKK